jgi:hypothetical protein
MTNSHIVLVMRINKKIHSKAVDFFLLISFSAFI